MSSMGLQQAYRRECISICIPDSDLFGNTFWLVLVLVLVQGLGRDGSGMVEPVQARASETRAGLGIHQAKKVDPSLEVQAGDSYKAVIQKKAIARFREMS